MFVIYNLLFSAANWWDARGCLRLFFLFFSWQIAYRMSENHTRGTAMCPCHCGKCNVYFLTQWATFSGSFIITWGKLISVCAPIWRHFNLFFFCFGVVVINPLSNRATHLENYILTAKRNKHKVYRSLDGLGMMSIFKKHSMVLLPHFPENIRFPPFPTNHLFYYPYLKQPFFSQWMKWAFYDVSNKHIQKLFSSS